jgi:hypothetical protein
MGERRDLGSNCCTFYNSFNLEHGFIQLVTSSEHSAVQQTKIGYFDEAIGYFEESMQRIREPIGYFADSLYGSAII